MVKQSPEAIDTELRTIASEVVSLRERAGRLVVQMSEINGWTALGYKSQSAWIESIVRDGAARSTILNAARHLRALPGLPDGMLDKIPDANLKMLKLLPERQRTELVLEKAQGSAEDFAAYLNQEHNLHVSAPKKLVFEFDDDGQYEDVKRALKNYQASQQSPIPWAQALWEALQHADEQGAFMEVWA